MANEENQFTRPSLDEFPVPTYDEWKAAAIESLKGADFDKKLLTKTYEGITLKPIYTDADYSANPERPGEGDYLRGTDPAGYMDHPWAIAQEVNAVDPAQANKQILHELDRGATAVNVKLCGGIKVENEADMAKLFEGVVLPAAGLHVTAGGSAISKLKLAKAAVKDFDKAEGCFGADPIGMIALRGGIGKTLEKAYDDMAESVKFAKENAPKLRTVIADGNVYANGGATAVQEAAYVIATASDYIAAMMERGISADDAAKSICLSVSLGSNFFMEIAKLRAMRVVYARMARAYGAGDEAAKADVYARTSAFTKTVFDPYVNILRTTTEAFSGVVGGINAMSVSPLDEAIGESDETSKRIARNLQLMLREEFDLLHPVDPAGGSWYVETLTGELIKAISDKFKEIEANGGMYAMLEKGEIQAEVKKVLNERFKKLATRADRAVGTNMYANMSEKPLERAAKPAGQPCCGGSRAMHVEPIEQHRWTEQFEALRKATDDAAEKTGKRLSAFLVNMGPIPQHKARADFSRGFLEVGGINVIGNDGFECPNCAVKAAVESGADVAVICSTDDTYPELVPAIAKGIKEKAPNMLVMLAGAPAAEFKPSYDEAGVDEYIHVKANCLEILKKIQSERGIG
mgnify:FL=1